MTNHSRIDQLVHAATAARRRAYAPYSGFAVGAAVLTVDGTTVIGCNVENAAFGLGICAERAAVCAAVAAGHTAFEFVVIAASPLAAPCGACRQFLGEFGELNVICVDALDTSIRSRWTIEQLLPERFKIRQPRGKK